MATGGTHTEHEDKPWTIAIGDHPARKDTLAYRHSRSVMIEIVKTTQPWVFGDRPYQDHHGGGIWLKDDTGWLLTLSPFGIEWSAQFCADPKKVDVARGYCARLLAAFPQTIPAYEALGYKDAAALLSTQITNADQVSAWTDGIFNASVPLPADMHTGSLPSASGYHHYPKPIVDIMLFKFDDFTLFVPDEDGTTIAVTPVARRGSRDRRVAVAWQPEGHVAGQAPAAQPDADAGAAAPEALPPPAAGAPIILPADSSAARHAFANQA